MDPETFSLYYEGIHPMLFKRPHIQNIYAILMYNYEAYDFLIYINQLRIKPSRKFNLLRQWYIDFRPELNLVINGVEKCLDLQIKICSYFYRALKKCIYDYFELILGEKHFDQRKYGCIFEYEQIYVIANFFETLSKDRYFSNISLSTSVTSDQIKIRATEAFRHDTKFMCYWFYSIYNIPYVLTLYPIRFVDFYSPIYQRRSRIPCKLFAKIMNTLILRPQKLVLGIIEGFDTIASVEKLIITQERECLEQELKDVEKAVQSVRDIPIVKDGQKPLSLMILEDFIFEGTKALLQHRKN